MRILPLLALMSLALSATSCGKWAKANSEHVSTMTRPEFPNPGTDVFALNSPKTRTSYRGTLFIANDNASVPDFAELINASVASRQAWAAIKKFEVETDYINLYGDTAGAAQKQVNLMKAGLQAFEIDALGKSPISNEAKLANAHSWIGREVQTLGLTAEQTKAFDAGWGRYCEAKIIELAAHPLLAQNLFKSPPSPTPLCQNYYTAHDLLTGPDCTLDGGDYLKCVWLDGVMKTRWFTSPNEATDPALAEARASKRLRLANLFSDANYPATRGILGGVKSFFILTAPKIYQTLFVDRKDAFLAIALDQKSEALCPKVITNVGSQDLCRIFGLSPEEFTPRQVIKIAEGSATANENIFPILTAPPGRTVTTQQLLCFVNERSGFEPSESDRLFLDLKEGAPFSQPTYSSAGPGFSDHLTEYRTALAAEFYGMLSPVDQAAKTEKLKTIGDLEDKILTERAEWTKLNDVITETTNRGLTAANRPGFGHGFIQYAMIYQQVANILSAEYSFLGFENYAFRACFDLVLNASIPCPLDLPLKEGKIYQEAKLSRAADGGKIEFSFVISPTVEIGMGPKARVEAGQVPAFFMDLPVSEVEGRTLRFELYRNRLDEYLDIMTGKAFIEEAGQRRYEAGISMWEQSE